MLFYPLYYDVIRLTSLKITQAFLLLPSFAKNQRILKFEIVFGYPRVRIMEIRIIEVLLYQNNVIILAYFAHILGISSSKQPCLQQSLPLTLLILYQTTVGLQKYKSRYAHNKCIHKARYTTWPYWCQLSYKCNINHLFSSEIIQYIIRHIT